MLKNTCFRAGIFLSTIQGIEIATNKVP